MPILPFLPTSFLTEEIERKSDKPHRGRLMELPGSVLPGMWEANVRSSNIVVKSDGHANNSNIPKEEETEELPLHALSLSLRHVSASSSTTPLEKYYTGEQSTPEGYVVSLIDPSFNRVSSFIKQGVFTNEEVDYCVDEGEEKMLNDSYHLRCLLLVAFDGFTSSSDSTNDAEHCSEAMLAKCVWPLNDDDDDDDEEHEIGRRRHELHMFGGDKDSEATGVLFPCKLDFGYEYYILISHDAKLRISAMDGK